ncbi:MAG: PAS domain-containing sensor histidine kinase [Thermodesulfobacteriota bacterium]
MTPFNKNEKEKFKALSIPRHIYLLITFLILLAIGGLAYGLYVGYYFPVCYGNLLNTVQKMHHETTMGHLCFEELLNSDSRTDLQEVVDHYSKAYRYSQVMLKKESHDKLDLLPLSEKNLRHRISAIQAKLEELKKISRQLQAEVGSLGPDSVKNNNYDALYNELLNHTALVTEDLQGVTAEKRKTFCVTLSLLIAVILLLALILFILVRKFERRRAQAYVDLKKTQEQLRESEERYRSLIENIDLGIVLVDADCRIIMANQAQADLFDVRLDDLLDKKCHEIFFQGGEEHCDLCPVNRAKEEEGAVEECLEIERIDGSRFRARIKVFPFQSSNQNGGFIKVTEDITDRLQTEEALAAEKERLAVTLRSIGDGVITTDTEGKVTMINKVAEDLTGWPQHEAEGRPLIEVFRIINELTRAVCDNPVEKVLSSGRIVGLANHTALISRDGTQRTIADSGSPIRDHQSRIIGVVLVFRDVTRQLQMEKEITKVKKLESIGVLAGGIAHDFNNILTGILGNLNLALFDGNMEKGTRKLLTEAEKASVRAKALTAQLLTFSQGGEPIKETASFEEVIRDSVEFILHGDRVAAKFDIPEDLWLVDIDKGQMSQVVQNLVLNASHAMPEGGLIEITGENIHTISDEHIFLASDQKYIKITITDYGIGIPESFVEKIFDPYFSTKQEGSGLGLPIR